MKIAVRFQSRSGNTKKVACAIASELKIDALSIDNAIDEADLLFIGGAIYAGKMHNKLKQYFESLSSKIKNVAIFSTKAGSKSFLNDAKEILKTKNIIVYDIEFSAKGKFLFSNIGRPNEEDLKNAAEYAKKVTSDVLKTNI